MFVSKMECLSLFSSPTDSCESKEEIENTVGHGYDTIRIYKFFQISCTFIWTHSPSLTRVKGISEIGLQPQNALISVVTNLLDLTAKAKGRDHEKAILKTCSTSMNSMTSSLNSLLALDATLNPTTEGIETLYSKIEA